MRKPLCVERMQNRILVTKFASLLRKCGISKALSQGKRIHDYLATTGLEKNLFVANLLIEMYGKCGALQDARFVFDNMHIRNAFSWNIMIVAYIQQGYLEDAFEIFQQIPHADVVSWTAMISGYAQHGKLKEALQLFQDMPQRDEAAWNAIIAGCAHQGKLSDAMQLFQQMPHRNLVTYNLMIAMYAEHGLLLEAVQLFHQMPRHDVITWTSMLTVYVQYGDLNEAIRLFEQMPLKNIVSWTAMIGGYAQEGMLDQALQLFQQMQGEGVRPNEITFLNLLDGCAGKAALAQGKQVHTHSLRFGFCFCLLLENALMNMYAKCGSLKDACRVFDRMAKRDVFSWNAVVGAYAHHGDGMKALQIFQHMKVEGVMPDHVTFYCILPACGHCSLVDESCHYFQAMCKEYRITPTLKHYNCSINILGRIEWLDEAEAFINNMPFQPDATSWRALCQLQSDVK